MADVTTHHFFNKNKRLIALAIFIFAAVILTYPLVMQFTTHISSVSDHDGDAPIFLWNMWWFKHALIDLHQNPYHATTIMWPQNPSLAFHTLAPVNDLIGLPFMLALPPIVAFNCVFWILLVLTGYCTFALAHYLTKHFSGSVIAGLLFAYCPLMVGFSLGHFNFVAAWMIPLYLLFLWQWRDRFAQATIATGWRLHISQLRPAIFAAIVLAFQYWNDSYFFVFLVLASLIFFLVFRKDFFAARIPTHAFSGFCLAGIMFLAIVSPLAVMQIRELTTNGPGFYAYTIGDQEAFSSDVAGFFIPPTLNPLLGRLATSLLQAIPVNGEAHVYGYPVYFGVGALILSVIGLLYAFRHVEHSKTAQYFFFSALAFGILSLGPTVFIAGHRFLSARLPAVLFAKLPVLDNLRVPIRSSIVVYFIVALLAAFGVRALLQKKSKGAIAGLVVLLGLVAVEYAPIPRQTLAISRPAIYSSLQAPKNGTILEMPFGRVSGKSYSGVDASVVQAMQIWHGRNILNGSVSRTSVANLDALNAYAELRYVLHPTIFPVPHAAEDGATILRLQSFGISEVVVHGSYFSKEKATEIETYLLRFCDRVATSENGLNQLYRLR